MKKYEIKPSGSSRIQAALCLNCAQGKIGESLVLNGCTQASFSLFIARLAAQQLIEKGKTPEQLADLFEMVSAANASAARQALAQCNLFSEEISEKDKAGNLQPVLVETYWKMIGGVKSAPNLSAFD